VPGALIKNGWHVALEPTELATYIMFVILAQRYPIAHLSDGLGAAPAERRRWCGVTPEVYEVHNELTAFGLLERQPDSVPGRRRGRVATAQLSSDLVTFAFRLRPEALDRDAFDTVTTSLADPLHARYMQDPTPLL
jgi:hypothetical protein